MLHNNIASKMCSFSSCLGSDICLGYSRFFFVFLSQISETKFLLLHKQALNEK